MTLTYFDARRGRVLRMMIMRRLLLVLKSDRESLARSNKDRLSGVNCRHTGRQCSQLLNCTARSWVSSERQQRQAIVVYCRELVERNDEVACWLAPAATSDTSDAAAAAAAAAATEDAVISRRCMTPQCRLVYVYRIGVAPWLLRAAPRESLDDNDTVCVCLCVTWHCTAVVAL